MNVFAFAGSKRRALSLVGAAALSLSMVVPALADNSVSTEVTAGSLSASVATTTVGTSGQTAYSHSTHSVTGTLALTADDSTGSGSGWNVTIQSSNFVYSGSNGGTDISAANFTLVSVGAPSSTAGQAVDTSGTDQDPTGPQKGTLAGVSGTLNSARKVLRAGANYGQGTYTQNESVSLSIPGQSRAGTYTATLTVSIASAP
jgi:hypothetical protein